VSVAGGEEKALDVTTRAIAVMKKTFSKVLTVFSLGDKGLIR
jgi:hypothetical protein